MIPKVSAVHVSDEGRGSQRSREVVLQVVTTAIKTVPYQDLWHMSTREADLSVSSRLAWSYILNFRLARAAEIGSNSNSFFP